MVRVQNLYTWLLIALFAALSACSILPGNRPPETISESKVSVVHRPLPPLPSRGFTNVAPEVELLGDVQMLHSRPDNTFSDLARQHNLGYQELRAANPTVDPWLPGDGTAVYLPNMLVIPDAPRDGVIVNLPSMRLLYFSNSAPSAGTPRLPTAASYPIGIGREGWATPTGAMRVIQKTRNPKWYPPASVRAEHLAEGDPLPEVVPPGPDNPLGLFKIRLSQPNYLIHGTNKPAGVGMRISHGCIRLYPEDIEALFEHIPLKTPVHIVDQPVLAGWRNGELYLEVHTPLAEDKRDLDREAMRVIDAALQRAGAAGKPMNHAAIATIVRDQRGIPFPIGAGALGPAEYLATARLVENPAAESAIVNAAND